MLPSFLSFFKIFSIFVNEFPVHSYLKNFEGNVLILHSQLDELVPYDQAIKNQSIAKNSQLINIGGTHNHPILSDDVINQLSRFIRT